MKWPLKPIPDCYPKLHFAPLPEMHQHREKAKQDPDAAAGGPAMFRSTLSNRLLEIVSCLRSAKANEENNFSTLQDPAASSTNEREYWARIATALIVLGHGLTDEAHDLVAPLSWPEPLSYSYGPPVNVTSHVALAFASYTHCLVHRREGPHDSEFGMSGFGNANYWSGASLRSGGEHGLPLPKIRNVILTYANKDSKSQEWMSKLQQQNLFEEWDPRVLTELIEQVYQNHQQGTPHELTHFAEHAALLELRTILNAVLEQLGYDTTGLQVQ